MIKFKNLEEKAKKRLLRKRALSKMQLPSAYKGKESLYPKIHTEKKKEESPIEDQVSETLISTGDSYLRLGS